MEEQEGRLEVQLQEQPTQEVHQVYQRPELRRDRFPQSPLDPRQKIGQGPRHGERLQPPPENRHVDSLVQRQEGEEFDQLVLKRLDPEVLQGDVLKSGEELLGERRLAGLDVPDVFEDPPGFLHHQQEGRGLEHRPRPRAKPKQNGRLELRQKLADLNHIRPQLLPRLAGDAGQQGLLEPAQQLGHFLHPPGVESAPLEAPPGHHRPTQLALLDEFGHGDQPPDGLSEGAGFAGGFFEVFGGPERRGLAPRVELLALDVEEELGGELRAQLAQAREVVRGLVRFFGGRLDAQERVANRRPQTRVDPLQALVQTRVLLVCVHL